MQRHIHTMSHIIGGKTSPLDTDRRLCPLILEVKRENHPVVRVFCGCVVLQPRVFHGMYAVTHMPLRFMRCLTAKFALKTRKNRIKLRSHVISYHIYLQSAMMSGYIGGLSWFIGGTFAWLPPIIADKSYFRCFWSQKESVLLQKWVQQYAISTVMEHGFCKGILKKRLK